MKGIIQQSKLLNINPMATSYLPSFLTGEIYGMELAHKLMYSFHLPFSYGEMFSHFK